MTGNAKFLLSTLALVAVAAVPAVAKDAKPVRNAHIERAPAAVERTPAMVAEPGDRASAPVGPEFVGRSYWDNARRDFDRQMNRGI